MSNTSIEFLRIISHLDNLICVCMPFLDMICLANNYSFRALFFFCTRKPEEKKERSAANNGRLKCLHCFNERVQ